MRTDVVHRPAETETVERELPLPAMVLDTLEQGRRGLDRERRVVYANRRIEAPLGRDRHLMGLAGGRVFPGADALAQGATRETRDRSRPRARELTLKAESLPMRDEDGELTGFGHPRGRDLRDRGRRVPEEDRRLVSLGELSAYVAHEIRVQSAHRHPHDRPVRGVEVQSRATRAARTSTT